MNTNINNKNILDLGDRRELFIDDHIVDHKDSAIKRIFHEPVPRGTVFSFDQPWEGNSCGMLSVFRDEDIYRMYYRASGYEIKNKRAITLNPERTAYAYSYDGINWTRPKLENSGCNNLMPEHFTAVFKDTNPKVSAKEKYKAISVKTRSSDLDRYGRFTILGWTSPDGLNWKQISESPVYSKINRGLGDVSDDRIEKWLDSQNVVFWSDVEKCYVMYYRVYTYEGMPQDVKWEKPADYSKKRVRNVEKAVSYDYINWQRAGLIGFPEDFPSLEEQLYGNHIASYYRAPHIYIGFPLRYCDAGWTASHELLPDIRSRKIESEASLRSGTALTDSTLIWSRNGIDFERSPDSFLAPGRQRDGSWMYGDHALSWHLVEIKDKSSCDMTQMALYSTEAYRSGPCVRLRLYTLRPDGFASLRAGNHAAEILTKPLIFKGSKLSLNMSTSAVGYIKAEMTDLEGEKIKGLDMDNCDYIIGDETDREISWAGTSDLTALQGRPVRIRFRIKQAELFSLKFEGKANK